MRKFIILLGLFLATSLSGELNLNRSINPQYENTSLNFTAIAVSNLDDIYLLESNNHELYRLNIDGKIVKMTGGIGWDEYNFHTPSDLCLNAGLNIIIADKNNNRLVRYDKTINFISSFPDENSDIWLQYPKVVEITQDGIIFILQENIPDILKLDPENDSYQSIGVDVGKEFELLEPVDMFLTKKEELIVLEKSGRIVSFDRYGASIKIYHLEIEPFIPEKVIYINNHIFLISSEFDLYKLDENKTTKLQIDHPITDFYVLNQQLFLLTKSGRILVYEFK